MLCLWSSPYRLHNGDVRLAGTLVPFSRRLDIGGTKKVEEATLGISGNVPKLLAVKSLMFLASSAHGEIIYLITI